MTMPKRGVKDIRTHSGRVDQVAEPYRAFMRIGALEMERARRCKERGAALERVRLIEERFCEIDAEKEVLLSGVGGMKGRQLKGRGTGPEDGQSAQRPFRIRY